MLYYIFSKEIVDKAFGLQYKVAVYPTWLSDNPSGTFDYSYRTLYSKTE